MAGGGAVLQEAMGMVIAGVYVMATRFALPPAHR